MTALAERKDDRARGRGRPRKALPPSLAKAAGAVLVVVESSTRARFLEGLLGEGYLLFSTSGPLVDLPRSRLGIDLEGGFEPELPVVRGKAALLRDLLAAAGLSKRVVLAMQGDREGEAAAWQVCRLLRDRLPGLGVDRVVLDEPSALRASLASPRPLDEALVEAQLARRTIDRLIGFSLSSLLWKKVKNGLSSGRIQAQALRLVCAREEELASSPSSEAWSLVARFRKGRGVWEGSLESWKGGPASFPDETEARACIEVLAGAECLVEGLGRDESLLPPPPPFTTATLIRAAGDLLGFPARKTLLLAGRLHEGVQIGGENLSLITRPITDSTRVDPGALDELRAWIRARYPAALARADRRGAGGRREEGEAIRPTSLSRTPGDLAPLLGREISRLYALLWEGYVASAMAPAKRLNSEALVALRCAAGEARFRLRSSLLVEEGFTKVLQAARSGAAAAGRPLPELVPGEVLRLQGLEAKRLPPREGGRLGEADLVEALEIAGLHRPSGHLPALFSLLERGYVSKEGAGLAPTPLGLIVDRAISTAFPDLVDLDFSARLERDLEAIEEGRGGRRALVAEFWQPFKATLDEAVANLPSLKEDLVADSGLVCENCGRPLLRRLGRNGFFLACSGFPACKTTRSIPLAKCPRPGCGGDLVERRRALPKGAARGRVFYGCTRHPDCDFVVWHRPLASPCPRCGGLLVERTFRGSGPVAACNDPSCDARLAPDSPSRRAAPPALNAPNEEADRGSDD